MTDRGSGAVLALALVGVMVVVAMSVIALAAGLAIRQRAIGAADAAALAAADTASGAVGGEPCAVAARTAAAADARLTHCDLDGLIATVEVMTGAGPIPVTARSTAGPP